MEQQPTIDTSANSIKAALEILSKAAQDREIVNDRRHTFVGGDSSNAVFTASNLVNMLISLFVGVGIALGAYYNFKSDISTIRQTHTSELEALRSEYINELKSLSKDFSSDLQTIKNELVMKEGSIASKILIESNTNSSKFQSLTSKLNLLESERSQIQASDRLNSIENQLDNLSRISRMNSRSNEEYESNINDLSRKVNDLARGKQN